MKVAYRSALAVACVVSLVATPGLASFKALLLLCYFAYAFSTTRVTKGSLALAFSVLASLAVGLSTGLADDVRPAVALDHFARVAIFFAIFLCAARLQPMFATARSLDAICQWSALIAASAKVAIVTAVVVFGIGLDDIQAALGFETVTLNIGFNIQRLQFPSDIIILFLVACYVGGRSRWADTLFMVAVLIVAMLSFSRFIFICFFVGMFVRMIWLRKFDFLSRIAAALVLVVVIIFSDSLSDRFVGEGSEASDDTRVEQAEYLRAYSALNPLLGHGLGASVPGYLRSETIPYSYEMQWYATVMQLGWVGVAWFLANIATLLYRGVRGVRTFLCVSALFALWIASGFTNPFLTSLGSGVGFAVAIWRSRLSTATERDVRPNSAAASGNRYIAS